MDVAAFHAQDGQDFDELGDGEDKQDIGAAPEGGQAWGKDAKIVGEDREAGEEYGEDVADAADEDVLVVGDFDALIWSVLVVAVFVVGRHACYY